MKRAQLLSKIDRKRYGKRTKSYLLKFQGYSLSDLEKNGNLRMVFLVRGQTNDYLVTVVFLKIVGEVEALIHKGMSLKSAINLLVPRMFNGFDIQVHCTCPDFTYRSSYMASKNKYNAGEFEGRAPRVVVPSASCKHVAFVLTLLPRWSLRIKSDLEKFMSSR